MCIPANAVDSVMAVLGCGALAYALFGLLTGVIYDSEKPYIIAFANQPGTFVLYVTAVVALGLVLIDLGFKVGLIDRLRGVF